MTPYARALSLSLAALACTPDVELLRTAADANAPDARAPRWTLVASGTSSDLRAVWGAAPDDVWAVGDGGAALHWNGAAWSPTFTGGAASLTGVWTAHASDAWAVGTNPGDASPVALRWDGFRWAPAMMPPRGRSAPRGVWGSAADSVWVVGAPESPDTAIARWDGARWTPEFLGAMRPPDLAQVAGASAFDVWAAGEGPLAFHRAASGWEPPVVAPRGVILNGALCVTRDGALWAATTGNAVLRFAGATWTSFTPGLTRVRGLGCGQSDSVWAVGDGGRAARWNGAAWSSTAVPRPALTAVWGANNGEAWAVGPRGTIVRYTP
jgi:hypothetical protein